MSPYQGYYHLIETSNTQAVTRDGLSWQINVKILILAQRRGSFDAKPQKRVVLFGFWGQEQEIKRLPTNPLVNIDTLEQAVRPLLDNIAELAKHLPFTPVDDYELWLLDNVHQQPLVLLASASKPPLKSPKPHADTPR